MSGIKPLDKGSVHKISSGQVVVDLQTAIKELVENSLDAGATNIEVRFKEYGVESFEVIDNGSGIRPEDYDSIALKHHTSKLSSFTDLDTVTTFGFRGEALSSLCALSGSLSVTTSAASEAPVGTVIEFEQSGKVKNRKSKAARQRGTTVTVSGLFNPLPVRRKELERNSKREYGKALTLLHAYALVPCAKENNGVRLSISNQTGGKKTTQLRTDGIPTTRASVSAIWGPKALDNLADLDLDFFVEVDAAMLRRLGRTQDDKRSNEVRVRGLISKFSVACGRNGTDRQFFFVNGRPCASSKVQKAFNEVYRSFNATQSPFIVADFILPTDSCDINVSPDKRTILLHSESNLVQALKVALENAYATSRSTYDVNASQAPRKGNSQVERALEPAQIPLFLPDEETGAIQSSPPIFNDESAPIENEDTFGEPTLLSEPSSSAPRLSEPPQSRDAGPQLNLIKNVQLVDPASEDDQMSRQDGEAAALGIPATPPAIVAAPAERADQQRGSVRMPINADVRDNDDDDDVERREAQVRSRSPEDPPIPTVKPPARPVVRDAREKARGEQMVLGTAGASWSLRRQAQESSLERPRKKSRLEVAQTRTARESLRGMLAGFARTGSQVAAASIDEDVDEDEDDDDAAEGGIEDAHVEDHAMHDDSGVREEDLVSEVGMDGPPDTEPSDGAGDVDEPVEEDVTMEDDTIELDASPIHEVQDLTLEEDSYFPEPPIVTKSAAPSEVSHSSVTTIDEVVRTDHQESIVLSLDLSRIMEIWGKLRARLVIAAGQAERDRIAEKTKLNTHAGVGNVDEEEAVEALSRVINKSDFVTMEILGQFNLGFIIVRRRKSCASEDNSVEMDDLFIVDQHAADEKYNFETLQRTTKIDSQKLFRPQILELTAADELVAIENIDVLRHNGFELDVSEDRPPGQRVQMTAQPISKSTVFDIKDLEELLHLMQDRPAGQMVRCSKARAMFAMRACRKSIMIGTPLSRRQMTSVVQHMGTMDQPWHCPHGRPTMRHLSDVVGIGWDRRGPRRRVNWAAFGRAGTA